MTELDLTTLREVAEAANQWTEQVFITSGFTKTDLNMAHIAAFDPPTVLALIDEIERLQKFEPICTSLCVANLDPEEDCLLHGRTHRETWELVGEREAEIERLRETLATVKAITDGTPECDKYDDKSPVTCGWKFDLQRIKEVVK